MRGKKNVSKQVNKIELNQDLGKKNMNNNKNPCKLACSYMCLSASVILVYIFLPMQLGIELFH